MRIVDKLVTGACIVLMGGTAWAAVPPPLTVQNQGSVQFMTGGVGKGERAQIRERAGRYDLWLTVSRPDGAYLSGIAVRIQDGQGKTVVDTTTNGPFLLVSLPPGRYAVRAESVDSRPGHWTVDVPKTGQDRVFLTLARRS